MKPIQSTPCEHERCITCGDVADLMVALEVDEPGGLALCEDEAGRRHLVEIALVGAVRVADQLLVHAGTAIAFGEPVG